ncbi:hypothetical protein HHI36_015074 [Cryptolaemus montrouzieri]|uniref:Uncharacterized protein n=1 Tax=Cryptolaemus montrouzieri TaxID=559131 RepID=A0ABD2N4Z6_9CUCU
MNIIIRNQLIRKIFECNDAMREENLDEMAEKSIPTRGMISIKFNKMNFLKYNSSQIFKSFNFKQLFQQSFEQNKWGSAYNDQRGDIIEEIIDNLKLSLLNDDSSTRFNIVTGKSTPLDLSICDNDPYSILIWQPIDYTYNSIYYSIIIQNNQDNRELQHYQNQT